MTKRYFEFVEGNSSKFWEIWTESTEVKTRYGRIGAAGQTTVKDEGSESAAQKLYDKLILEKTKKGYVEQGGKAPKVEAPKVQTPKAESPKVAASKTPTDSYKVSPQHLALLKKIQEKAAKAGVKLPKGASIQAIQKAEEHLSIKFPPEVVAFFLSHDGGGDNVYAFNNRELLSLKGMCKQWDIWNELYADGTFEENEVDADPGVQEQWWIPRWIPLTYDGSGNHDLIDLAPAAGGTLGQVLDFWHDMEGRKVKSKDVLTWLSNEVEFGTEDDEGDDDDDGEVSGNFRRFEVDEKFWAIRLDGDSHTVKFGKIGTAGTEKTKTFDSDDDAQKDYDKLIKEKTKKGYEEID